MATASSAHEEVDQHPLPAGDAPARTRVPWARAAFWRTPAGLVIAAATVVGLGLRLFLVLRPGLLTSGTIEYDDGVYLGEAIRLLQGSLPYRDYASVQPPGILPVSLPFALIAQVKTTAAALAAARVASVLASAACIPLAGRLVRHKGPWVTLVTCGFLAVYPADVLTARTLLLEPWMNLLCLIAACAAFSNGRLASPRRLAWAGVLLGYAVTIKLWAGLPAAALLVCVLLSAREERLRRVRAYLVALVVAFAVPVITFSATAPLTFVRSAVFDQISRMGAWTPMAARLAYLTGLIPFIGRQGALTADPGSQSALAVGTNATIVTNGVRLEVPAALAVGGAVILAAAYLRRPRSRSTLEWFALAVAVVAVAAVGTYSAFFYHYPSFPAPWLAVALGTAAGAAAGFAGRAARAVSGGGAVRAAGRVVMAGAAVVLVAGAVLEWTQLNTAKAPVTPHAVERIIPSGACVVSDQVSFTLAADRFTASQPGCPDVLDSLANTLTVSGGVSVVAGAGDKPQVIDAWERVFSKAQYVWLTQGFHARIPWTPELRKWFSAHYFPVDHWRGYGNSHLYQHR